jgi:predicted lipoprotein with Yx(FWY)xxD motif
VNRTRTIHAFALLAVAAALAITGCGSSDNESGGAYGGKGSSATTDNSGKTTTSGAAGGRVTFVSQASVPKLGLVLVDSKGYTLYDFHKDKGVKSACYGNCAKVWPPLTTEGAPKPSNGAMASKLGTTERSDGSVQVTYAGHPLYTYVADKKPGEANGHDFSSYGAQWYALKANGEEVPD